MAGKKKNSAGVFRRVFSPLLRGMMIPLLLLAGAFLGNLDRMEHCGILLLQYKQFLPRPVRVFLPGGSAVETRAEARSVLQGKVIEVYDGDTMTLLDGEKKYRIRFYGIDAPEAAQPAGIAARDALRSKILGEKVLVQVMNTDPYGRAVGRVQLGARDINFEQLSEGWAWFYEEYAKGEAEYENAAFQARCNRLGLWQQHDPQPPWFYRKAQKNRSGR